MKILCVGFWKTGTKSLAQALRILGYKVYDYDEQFFAFPELWSAFLDGTVTDDMIRNALKDVDVIVDGPVIAYWEEIYRAIPDAKVILSTRDEDGWFKSLQETCKGAPLWLTIPVLFMFATPAGYRFLRNALGVMRLCTGIEGPFRYSMLTSTPTNARLYKMHFRKHNCHVMQTVDPKKLHVHEVSDGWEKLCKFLDKDVPDVPYPHENKLGARFKGLGGQHPEMIRLWRQSLVMMSILTVMLAYAVYKFVLALI